MKRGKRAKGAGAAAPRQGRKGAATREAILQSARIAFIRSGYDGVGVREIAQGASVTAMMVNRYFGSKEQLFAEVVDTLQSTKSILTGHAGTLGHEAAAALAATPARGLDGFLLLLRSSSNPQAVTILRDAIERNFQAPLAVMLPGGNARERAALLLSIIAGIQLMRQVVGLDALVAESPEAQSVLERELEALFDQLIRPNDPGSQHARAQRPAARTRRADADSPDKLEMLTERPLSAPPAKRSGRVLFALALTPASMERPSVGGHPPKTGWQGLAGAELRAARAATRPGWGVRRWVGQSAQ